MQDIWAIVFGTAVGFTLAGLLTSVYDVITNRRLSFAMQGRASPPEMLLGMLLRVAAGPFLLVRSAWDALSERSAGPVAIAAIVAVAVMWGCFSGIIVIDLLGGFAPAARAGL